MKKHTVSWKEIQQIIKEEVENISAKLNRASDIEKRLEIINEELSSLEEVEAGGLKTIDSTGWAADGDKKYDEKFEKIGSHLKEEEDEMSGEEMPEMGQFEREFAKIGKTLDDKLAGVAVDDVADADDEAGSEDSMMDNADDEAEEITLDNSEDTEDVFASDDEEEEKEEVEESVEEPIKGESPAQEAEEAGVEDYMEKDTHVKESTKESEKNKLFEGVDTRKADNLKRELEKMKRLANLSKNEDE